MASVLKDKVIIITGASSGIGAELAKQLGRMRAKVVLAARNEEKLLKVAKSLNDGLVVQTDVTDEAQCKRLIDEAVKHFGKIDILVNNAGISQWAMFEEITDMAVFKKIMDVNFFGTAYCTHYTLPHLKKSKGLIVGISSLTGKVGVPTRTAYSASKHAMEGFLNALRVELMGSGVDVSIISPGFVKSEVRINAIGKDGEPVGKSHLDENSIMSVEEAVMDIITAMEKRKRDVIIASLRSKLAPILKVFAPKRLDKIILKGIKEGQS